MKRRVFTSALCAGSLWAGRPGAQSLPGISSNHSRIVVTFAAGGPTDLVARLLAQPLSDRLGQQVIVENKPGAAGNIGALEVSRASPDGQTMVLVAPTIAVNPSLYPNAVDPTKDLSAVSQLVSLQYVLVASRRMGASDLRGFIERASLKGKPLSYASWGNGSHAHLCGALLSQMLGADMIHVAYKGSAPAMQDVIGGQVDFMFDSAATAVPQVRAGTVRAIAVSSNKALDALPSVPTLSSRVPGFDVTGWQGLMAPARTPPSQLSRWQESIRAILQDGEVRARLAAIGLVPVASSPADFALFLRSEQEKYAALIRTNNIKAD